MPPFHRVCFISIMTTNCYGILGIKCFVLLVLLQVNKSGTIACAKTDDDILLLFNLVKGEHLYNIDDKGNKASKCLVDKSRLH